MITTPVSLLLLFYYYLFIHKSAAAGKANIPLEGFLALCPPTPRPKFPTAESTASSSAQSSECRIFTILSSHSHLTIPAPSKPGPSRAADLFDDAGGPFRHGIFTQKPVKIEGKLQLLLF